MPGFASFPSGPALRSVDSAEGVYSSLFAALITTMAGSDCSTSCVNGLRDRPFRCGPGVATRRDKAEPSQVPVLDVQACVSSLTPQSPTTARQKRRRRCCLRPMGKPRHSRLCIFSVLNSSAHLPRCRRFTARLATSRARLAELRGVACSFAVEDLHLLPKHQLAWRTPDYAFFRCSIAPPTYPAADASRLASRRVAHGSRNCVEWLAPSP